MATMTGTLTVDECRLLPEPSDGTYYELHYGELVRLSNPKLRHEDRQKRIERVLERVAGKRGFVIKEFGFRALPEHDARRADVAFVFKDRYRKALEVNEYFGAPELVVEVLSPSNSAAERDDKESLCFANQCREFWMVNDERKRIRVTLAGGPVRWYGLGEIITSQTLEASVSVDDLFAGLDD